jgi:hypothetical protein
MQCYQMAIGLFKRKLGEGDQRVVAEGGPMESKH